MSVHTFGSKKVDFDAGVLWGRKMIVFRERDHAARCKCCVTEIDETAALMADTRIEFKNNSDIDKLINALKTLRDFEPE